MWNIKQEKIKNRIAMKKIIIFIILLAFILFAGFWGYIAALFSKNPFFYPILVSISVVSIVILTFLTLFFGKKMKKILIISWVLLPLLVVLSYFTFPNFGMYDQKIPRMSENDFDLREYQPFIEGTKAVFLNEVSTLALAYDLPILDGATALYPLYSAFAQAVYPEKEYKLNCDDCAVQYSNTMRAHQRFAQKGDVDIIFVAEPSEDQVGYALQHGVEYKKTVIGKEAFVFFVNANNPIDNLTVEQIKAIYSGKITNWKEVGGNNEKIRAFQRNEGSGSQTAFLNFMGEIKPIEPVKANEIGGMGGIIRMVSDYGNYGNSIGFSFRFFTQAMVNLPDVKILKVNDIYPDIESIKSGQYPITGNIYAITNAKNTKENVAKFLDWILSKQGQYLVEKTGYCPID